MRNTWLLPVLVMLVAAPMFSCNHDDPFVDPPPKSGYKPLNGPRDNVLFNLQKIYNERDIDRYDELLDDNFVFYFSGYDVEGGLVVNPIWSRASDFCATKNMFDPNFSKPDVGPVGNIQLALSYPTGDDKWTPITPPENHVTYAGETWYEKVVTYCLTVTAGDQQFIGCDLNASIVVRKATVEGFPNTIWRIVVWRDDTGARLGVPPVYHPRTGLSEVTTWGKMKTLYAE